MGWAREKVDVMNEHSNTHLIELALRLIRTTEVDAVLRCAVEVLAQSCPDARWAIFHRLEDGRFEATSQSGIGYDALHVLLSRVCGRDTEMFIRDDLVGHALLGAAEYHAMRIGENGAGAPDMVVAAWPYANETLSGNTQLTQVCELVSGALERAREMTSFRIQSTFDELTGLLNRRGLFSVLEREQARSDRHARTVSVLFVDLDRFKPINDTHGHVVGDQVLVTVARALENAVRNCDFVGRLAGDEFFVILPDISSSGVALVRERIVQAVADVMFYVGSTRLELGISVGAATHETGMSAEQLIKRADTAMYEMKRRAQSSESDAVFSSRAKLQELVERIHAA